MPTVVASGKAAVAKQLHAKHDKEATNDNIQRNKTNYLCLHVRIT